MRAVSRGSNLQEVQREGTIFKEREPIAISAERGNHFQRKGTSNKEEEAVFSGELQGERTIYRGRGRRGICIGRGDHLGGEGTVCLDRGTTGKFGSNKQGQVATRVGAGGHM